MRNIMRNVMANFAWYRKAVGGRWEKWMHDTGPDMWYHTNSELKGRPNNNCRGTPEVEIYPEH